LPAWKKLLFSAIVVLAVAGILEGGARLFVHVAAASNGRWEFHRKIIESVGFPALEKILIPEPVRFWAGSAGRPHRGVIRGRFHGFHRCRWQQAHAGGRR